MLHSTEIAVRPPIEAYSLQLEIASGCPQAKRCTFCTLYANELTPATRDQIKADIDEVADLWLMRPRRVFLQTAEPFAVPHDLLVFTLEYIRERLPMVESVGGFCSVATIARATDDQLADWARLGVSNLAIGAESGWDETLARANKQHCAQDIIDQCARLDAAGITYTLFYMPGLAGAGKGIQNAHESARVFSQTHPLYINCLTTNISPDSQLGKDSATGAFLPATESESLTEIRTFVAEVTCRTTFDCMNEFNAIKFMAPIPEGREAMLKKIDFALSPEYIELLENFTKQREEITRRSYPDR